MSAASDRNQKIQRLISLLLAEDDDSLRETLTLFFSSQGFLVHPAQTGKEAVDIAKMTKISFSVMDINMPDLGGIEAFMRIKAEVGRMPCIFMSGDSSEENIIRALDVGGFTFLTKPIQMELMRETVDRLVTKYFRDSER